MRKHQFFPWHNPFKDKLEICPQVSTWAPKKYLWVSIPDQGNNNKQKNHLTPLFRLTIACDIRCIIGKHLLVSLGVSHESANSTKYEHPWGISVQGLMYS